MWPSICMKVLKESLQNESSKGQFVWMEAVSETFNELINYRNFLPSSKSSKIAKHQRKIKQYKFLQD